MSLHRMHSHHAQPSHGRLPFFKSPLIFNQEIELLRRDAPNAATDDGASQRQNRHFAVLEGRAQHTLHHHEETTMAELFYDLFFVANLTTFTAVHPVNNANTLAQYLGYFAILWFTWYQVSLYDVRLAMDSIFERTAKALHLGVMVGFAMTGPDFNPGETDDDSGSGPEYGAFAALTIVLMASRLILVGQYLQTWWLTRLDGKVRWPLLIVAGAYLVAAAIYLGLFWSFHPVEFGVNHTYIVWYVIALLETAAVSSVFAFYRSISFEGTHLVQRMSLLNLIILGEGVIVLAKQCHAIIKSEVLTLGPSAITNVISAVLLIYFLYMMYTDWLAEEHMGRIRQQLWAFLHFPLHLFQVLAVEGASQAIAWRAATVARYEMEDQAVALHEAAKFFVSNATFWTEAAGSTEETAEKVLKDLIYVAGDVDRALAIGTSAEIIEDGVAAISQGAKFAAKGLRGIRIVYSSLCVLVYEVGGFNSGDDDEAVRSLLDSDSLEALEELLWRRALEVRKVFSLVFVYFFVSCSLVIVLASIIAALGTKRKKTHKGLRLFASGIIGATLLSFPIAGAIDPRLLERFSLSAYVLPTIVGALVLVVLLNSVPLPPSASKLTCSLQRKWRRLP